MKIDKQNVTVATMRRLWLRVLVVLRKYFNVMPDKEDEESIAQEIRKGVSFHGANLWI